MGSAGVVNTDEVPSCLSSLCSVVTSTFGSVLAGVFLAHQEVYDVNKALNPGLGTGVDASLEGLGFCSLDQAKFYLVYTTHKVLRILLRLFFCVGTLCYTDGFRYFGTDGLHQGL
jgi:hypothetical protein